jgi:hypothetical protein
VDELTPVEFASSDGKINIAGTNFPGVMNKTGRSDVASADKAGRSEDFAEAERPDTNVRPDIHVWVVVHKFAKQKATRPTLAT